MFLVGDEQDFIVAGNDCRVVRNLASLCPPPEAEHAVPLRSLMGKLQRQPWGEVSAGKQPRAVSWELADCFLLPNGTEVSVVFLLFLLLLGNLFLGVTQVLSATLTHSLMGMKPVETSTDIVSAVTSSGMQEEEGLGWRRTLERKSKSFSRLPRI